MKNVINLVDLVEAATVASKETQEELPESDIGSDSDFQTHALEKAIEDEKAKDFQRRAAALENMPEQWKDVQKAVWKGLEKKERYESSSIRRAHLLREGFHAGFSSAADDYSNKTVDLSYFETLRTERDITDFYSIGFEIGYFRKLAEILVA